MCGRRCQCSTIIACFYWYMKTYLRGSLPVYPAPGSEEDTAGTLYTKFPPSPTRKQAYTHAPHIGLCLWPCLKHFSLRRNHWAIVKPASSETFPGACRHELLPGSSCSQGRGQCRCTDCSSWLPALLPIVPYSCSIFFLNTYGKKGLRKLTTKFMTERAVEILSSGNFRFNWFLKRCLNKIVILNYCKTCILAKLTHILLPSFPLRSTAHMTVFAVEVCRGTSLILSTWVSTEAGRWPPFSQRSVSRSCCNCLNAVL